MSIPHSPAVRCWCLVMLAGFILAGCTSPGAKLAKRCERLSLVSNQSYHYVNGELVVAEGMSRKYSDQAIAACTETLAQPLSNEKKAHYLRYRALQYVGADQYAAALADLDRFEQLVILDKKGKVSDAKREAYEHSLIYGVTLLRAAALSKTGKQESADEMLNQLQARSRYSQLLTGMVLPFYSLDYVASREFVDQLDIPVKVNPALIESRYVVASRYSDLNQLAFNDALVNALDPYIQNQKAAPKSAIFSPQFTGKPARKPLRPDYSRTFDANTFAAMNVGSIAALDLATVAVAYGLAGQSSDAQNYMELARRSIEAQKQTDTTGWGVKLKVVNIQQELVDSLAAYHAGDYEESLALLEGQLVVTGALVQHALNLQQALPADEKAQLFAAKVTEIRLRERTRSAASRQQRALMNMDVWLPDRLQSASNAYSAEITFFRKSGFSEELNQDGSYTVSFIGEGSTIVAVEEMSILRAAEFSLEKGAEQFLILDNDLMKRTLRYQSGSSIDKGYEGRLRIYLLGDAGLPPSLQIHQARLMDARQIVNDLYTSYTGESYQ